MKYIGAALFVSIFVFTANCLAQARTFSGSVVTAQFELVRGVKIEIQSASQTVNTVTDAEGRFSANIPPGQITVTVSGNNIAGVTRTFSATDKLDDVQLKVTFVVPQISESVTIQADALTPNVEFRNDTIYKNSLFGRDDQLLQTLNAGINVGQHEGGGKSVEVRRFGFNLDHGGVNGGLKILVDDVQQNQGTQGHGQGYLGSLKSLSPELVQDVSIINGPFSAAYGDFSGLGVVHIQLKEDLPQIFTARIQGGSFNTFRGFFAYSPAWKKMAGFIAYEPSYSDGPFLNKLRYRRDNLTGNLTYKFDEQTALGFKLNLGRNDFTSSGQLPLDLVNSGALDRFGFIDPHNGGRVQLGTAATYFRREFASGATLRADAFVGRSLFDLFSNFTFFAADPVYGDEIQQHDSRLTQGANVQYLTPYEFFGTASILTVGGNFHADQINVGLYPSVARDPDRKFLPGNAANPDVLFTTANVKLGNYASYAQNQFNFFDGHLRLELGLRFDYFTFGVKGYELSDVRTDIDGRESQGKFQPKASIALSPFERVPVTFYLNYGRGISSQDARGIVRDPSSPKLSTTDFYQAGTSYNGSRFSAVVSSFLIDRSNEQVYIPDDGTTELAGPSRSYGVEVRTSLKITKSLSFNGGLTNVIAAFYRGELAPDGRRRVVDSAPHFVANAGLVLNELRGFNGSLTLRDVSHYRLDPDDPTLTASGNDVVDLAVSRHLRKWVDLNFAIDNLLNKKYYETQNYFESRTCPTCALTSRIHATPGYPLTASIGLTFRLGNKK
ncbi:MAG: TonB-dependent receptor [Acidobacteriota bacterium]